MATVLLVCKVHNVREQVVVNRRMKKRRVACSKCKGKNK